MSQTALILGSSGKFGRNAAAAFETAGWTTRRFDRQTDDLRAEIQQADVLVNAWNPPDYSTWDRDLLNMHRAVIDAAKGTDVTLIVPGNVYPFGAQTPAPWSEHSPRQATNPLGRLRIEMEAAYKASGIQTIVLRGGDFIDTEASGNWFDLIMVRSLAKGRFTYPGALDLDHAWAYLPDIARAAVALAEQRADLPTWNDIAFPGYTLTGAQMGAALEGVTGAPLKSTSMNWLPLRLLSLFAPNFRGLIEMRYLWDTPHRLDGTAFNTLLPDFEPTPLTRALAQAVAHAVPSVAPDQPKSAGAASRPDGPARAR